MSGTVCVDSSLALKLFLPEADSQRAQNLWERWMEMDAEIVAPPLFLFEVTSVLCRKVTRDLLTLEEAQQIFSLLQGEPWRFAYLPGLHERALTLAVRFRQSQVYDAHYLALAEAMACEFWTADERLYRAVAGELSWVRWLGDYV